MTSNFFNAIKQGDLEEVRRLVSITPTLIHEREDGGSPIMTAAYHHQPQTADFLVEKTIHITIFEAASIGKVNQIMRQLAYDPLLVNAYAEDGYQPLGLACYFGHYEAAEYLIKAGASINSPSRNPRSTAPIHSATRAGHAKIVMLLLNHNADPNVREQGGRTALHAAAQLGDSQIIRSLIFYGANLDIRSLDGKLPIDMALEAGHKEAAGLLREGITRRFRVLPPSAH